MAMMISRSKNNNSNNNGVNINVNVNANPSSSWTTIVTFLALLLAVVVVPGKASLTSGNTLHQEQQQQQQQLRHWQRQLQEQVMEEDRPLMGSNYCTWSPNTSCFENGWPSCCGNETVSCPESQPECEVNGGAAAAFDNNVTNAENNETPTIVGTSICTYAPNYECYLTGWPECCAMDGGVTSCREAGFDADDESESSIPECDRILPIVGSDSDSNVNDGNGNDGNSDNVNVNNGVTKDEETIPPPGSSACTYAPNYECYTTGWPECCRSGDDEDPSNNNNSATSDGGCPQGEQPECDKTLLGDSEDSSGASTGVLFRVTGTSSSMLFLGVAGSGFVFLF